MSLAALLLMSCATPSNQIASALGRYGLDAERAQCVGSHLETHLSLGQLRQLGRAARAYRGGTVIARPLNPADLLQAASEIHDAKVPLEVAQAGIACRLLG